MSTVTSDLVHQLSSKSSLIHLTTRPARATTFYTTSPLVLQELPHSTPPQHSSCKSYHILHHLSTRLARATTFYTTSALVPQELPHSTPPQHSSHKSYHILHHLTSRPARATTFYTTSPVIAINLTRASITCTTVLKQVLHFSQGLV